MADFASAGGHWYLPDGTPYYTMVGANGVERNVTLRDARKVGALPSVTGIINCAAKEGLEVWKRKQLALALLTLPRIDGETPDAFLLRAEQDWREEGKTAAEKGTRIHAAIEKHYRGEIPDPDLFDWVRQVKDTIASHVWVEEWMTERSFACPLGYGGKTDLHSQHWVLDIKTKDGLLEGHKLFDEHIMQLAAYRHGLGIPTASCGIVFVRRDAPEAVLIEADQKDLDRGWNMFVSLLQYWQAKNNYRP